MTYASHDDEILSALQRGDVLTPAVAHARWGVLALHSAIARLRKRGHVIPCKMVDGHGQYRISNPVPAPLPNETVTSSGAAGAVSRSAPQRSTATARIAPSREGAGQGDAAVAGHRSPVYDSNGKLLCYCEGVGPGWPPSQDAERKRKGWR